MATPPNRSAVQTPTGPNGAPVMRIRRPRAADPLVRPKKKPGVRPSGTALPSRLPANGTAAVKPVTVAHPASNAHQGVQSAKAKPFPARDDMTVNGFSGPLLSDTYVDYPLVTTKRAWREGLKFHVAKFASKKNIDPRDETQFTRPVRLQRRDPRAKMYEAEGEKGEGGKKAAEGGNVLDDAEREEIEARKAAREREREENIAQIAPSASTTQRRANAPKQKTQQVFKTDMTPEEIAKARIKYEEALPWHLEDFDNKNTWVGSYEAALSDTYAMFVLEGTGRMRMIPIDKWYKFSAKNQFKALTIEEAEKFMAKKIKDPRWFMEKQQELAQQKELQNYAKQRKVYRGKQTTPGGEGLEADEMDFEEDRFADDEEHDALFDEDEEAKAAEKRIKQDQLKANVFDLKEEKEYEEEELKEKREKEARRILGKRVRKALQRREKNYDYSSGSDVNPYSDDESSGGSEAERLGEEERKAEEERNKKAKESDKNSGTSTKGTNTPSGRPKHTDPLKKAAGLPARKRPGSPNLSDASGTDTSRKKPKSKHASSQPTPQPGSRPMSPAPSTVPLNKKRVRSLAVSSGNDVDGGAGSAGEVSESGRTKKLKFNPPATSSQNGTPQGSRAGSPAPLGGKAVVGSRASSPEGGISVKGQQRVSTPGPAGQQTFPTPAEIHAAIPAAGILSSDLLKIFRPRIGESKENHRRFITIVRDVGVYGKEDRLLRPGILKEA